MPITQVLEADWTCIAGSLKAGVRVAIDADGNIAAVGPLPQHPVTRRLPGRALLPGFVNAHSHAFQRGLRGLGETYPAGMGDFWSWREAMYGLVLRMTPAEFHALCLQAFREMLAGGFTTVGEFHYVHHSRVPTVEDREPDYELDEIVLDAARAAGIRIVLLQSYYRMGGFAPAGRRGS